PAARDHRSRARRPARPGSAAHRTPADQPQVPERGNASRAGWRTLSRHHPPAGRDRAARLITRNSALERAQEMAAQKGKDLLLKIDSDGLGAFETVAGLRSRSLSFNTEVVDITHQESTGQWRELLAGAGA